MDSRQEADTAPDTVCHKLPSKWGFQETLASISWFKLANNLPFSQVQWNASFHTSHLTLLWNTHLFFTLWGTFGSHKVTNLIYARTHGIVIISLWWLHLFLWAKPYRNLIGASLGVKGLTEVQERFRMLPRPQDSVCSCLLPCALLCLLPCALLCLLPCALARNGVIAHSMRFHTAGGTEVGKQTRRAPLLVHAHGPVRTCFCTSQWPRITSTLWKGRGTTEAFHGRWQSLAVTVSCETENVSSDCACVLKLAEASLLPEAGGRHLLEAN